MNPCHWCFAEVVNDSAAAHAAWHRAHELHSANCGFLKRLIAQRLTSVYLHIVVCDCGLHAEAQA